MGGLPDGLSCGRPFLILDVIDDFSRECLAAVVETSLTDIRVARKLDRITQMRGYACMEASPSRDMLRDARPGTASRRLCRRLIPRGVSVMLR